MGVESQKVIGSEDKKIAVLLTLMEIIAESKTSGGG